MAQTFTSTEVVTTTNVFVDNQSQRTNENTLRSSFSGATQPSDPVVGQVWYDTANSKQMQYNGTSWVSIDTNGTTQKDVTNAKGNLTSLTDYLRVAHNDDGTLKTSPATAIDEFKDNALAITYVSTSSFTVPTDLTSIFTVNRKVKIYLDTSTAISYVSSSSYSSGDNKTTVVLGGTVLDSSVTAVKYSIIQYGERQDTLHTADLSTYAPLTSPALTGIPTAPTAPNGTSTTQLATTEFVSNAMGTATAVVPNNISSGRKVTSVSGLTVNLSAGTSVINNITKGFSSGSVGLPARKACLIVDKSDGTTGYIEGKYPIDYIDDNTVGAWVFNKAPGENVPNSAVGLSSIAVANDLVPSGGISAVDGHCDTAAKLDGTSGYFTSQNHTNIPIGANEREVTLCYTLNGITGTEMDLFTMGANSGTSCFAVFSLPTTREIVVYNGTTAVRTGYVPDLANVLKIVVKYDGTTIFVSANGTPIYKAALTLNTAASNIFIGKYVGGASYFAPITLHYLEVRNKMRSDKKTAEISNKLMLPCFYTDTNSKRRSIIDDVVPTNAIAVAYAKTSTSGVSESNDLWPMYGRREGSTGGNRKQFLGFRPFSGAGAVNPWTNVFRTNKIKMKFSIADDAVGTNEREAPVLSSTASAELYFPSTDVQPLWDKITVWVGTNGVRGKSSGYIGCYAELLEDYVGVV